LGFSQLQSNAVVTSPSGKPHRARMTETCPETRRVRGGI